MSNPTPRSSKTADFGALRTGFASTIVKCKSPDTFATRLDIQTNQNPGWDVAYVSGFRLYCNDNSPAQPLNWNRPSNDTTYTSFNGSVVNDGVKDMIVSHGQYVNLVGYGSQTLHGNLKDVRLWQQAQQKDYNECVLVGVECTYVAWFDGCRMHFSCPSVAPGSKPTPGSGATAEGAAASADASTGGFAVGTFAGGIGVGVVVAAALLALVVFVRGRRAANTQEVPTSTAETPNQQQPTMQVVTSDPYAAVFNGNSNSATVAPQSALPPSMAAVQYADVHLMSPYSTHDGAQQMAAPNGKSEWQHLPKP